MYNRQQILHLWPFNQLYNGIYSKIFNMHFNNLTGARGRLNVENYNPSRNGILGVFLDMIII